MEDRMAVPEGEAVDLRPAAFAVETGDPPTNALAIDDRDGRTTGRAQRDRLSKHIQDVCRVTTGVDARRHENLVAIRGIVDRRLDRCEIGLAVVIDGDDLGCGHAGRQHEKKRGLPQERETVTKWPP